jgi:hypothetical protein
MEEHNNNFSSLESEKSVSQNSAKFLKEIGNSMAEIINYDKEADKKIIQENAQEFGFVNLLNTLQILAAKNIEDEFDSKSNTSNIERSQKSFSYNLENTYKFINNNGDINNKNLKLTTKNKEDEGIRKICNTSSQNFSKNIVKNCLKNSNLNVINDGFTEVKSSCSKESCESKISMGSCCDKNPEEHKVKTNHSLLEETEHNVFKPSSLTKHMRINKDDIICIKDFTIMDYNIEELEKSFSRSKGYNNQIRRFSF